MINNILTIKENQGNHISVAGGTYHIIISGKQSAGEFAIIDMQIPPGGGPGPHAHASFHETFYVVDGELEFRTEDGRSLAQKGDVITVPKGGAVHAFKNVGDRIAHLLCTVVPAGLDDFFEEIGTSVQPGEFLPAPRLDKKAVEQLMMTGKKYGQVVYPPDYLDR